MFVKECAFCMKTRYGNLKKKSLFFQIAYIKDLFKEFLIAFLFRTDRFVETIYFLNRACLVLFINDKIYLMYIQIDY